MILQAKHLQFVSGVHSSSYWLATFAWDLLNALVPIVISVIIFAAFRVDAFSSPEALVAIFVLLVSGHWYIYKAMKFHGHVHSVLIMCILHNYVHVQCRCSQLGQVFH